MWESHFVMFGISSLPKAHRRHYFGTEFQLQAYSKIKSPGEPLVQTGDVEVDICEKLYLVTPDHS